MEIKKEINPSKVVIIPRPPRSVNPGMAPAGPAGMAGPGPSGIQPGPHDQPFVPVDPGTSPLNHQVDGPAGGLAGIPSEKK